MLLSLGINPNEINFHAIHRVGNRRDRTSSSSNTNSTAAGEEQSQRSRPRPILARFISRMDVDAVWERTTTTTTTKPLFRHDVVEKLHSLWGRV